MEKTHGRLKLLVLPFLNLQMQMQTVHGRSPEIEAKKKKSLSLFSLSLVVPPRCFRLFLVGTTKRRRR